MFHRLVGVGRRFLKYFTSALAKRRIRRHRRLWLLEPLAARQVLAAYTATSDSATLTINNTGEQLSITADSSDYVITTSGGTNWTGPAATGVTATTNTLRLAKSTFTGTISIVDQSGISSGSVTFTSNSGASYGANFTVTLNDSPGTVTFNGSNPSFGGNNLTVTTTGGTGNIVFSNSGTVAATTGSISLTSSGSITVGNSSAVSTTSGSLSLAANGAVQLGTSAAVSTTSGTLGVTATTGAISFGSSASIASTSGGNVTLSSGTSVSATVDSVADVSGGVVSITSASGIALNTAATSASLTVSSTGAINVSDTAGGLTVTSATTAAGSITLSAAGGNLTLTTVSATGGAINATTTSSGSILVDSVTAANGTVTLTSMGTIEEVGSGDAGADVTGTSLTLTAVTGIGVNSGSTLEIDAVVGSAAGQLTASVSGAGALDVQDTAGGLNVVSATTSNGAVTIAAVGGDLSVSSATAGGSSTNMTLTKTTSGNITLTNLTNTGDRVTVNSAGSIIDSLDTLTDITADGVVLIATAGIGVGGSAADTELEIAATNLDVRNATSGGVKVNRTGGSLTVTDLDASGGAHLLNGGGYITAANALTIAMSLSTDDSFTFTASNSSTANDDLTINNSAVVTLTNAAARNLTFQAGDDLILGTGGTITTAGGGSHTVVLDVDREGAAVADGDRGGVTQDSGTTTRVTAGTLTVTAPDGVGSSGQSVYIAAGVLTVSSAGNNRSQFLVEADGLTEFSLAAGTGSVTMTVTTGDLISADSAVDIAASAATVTLAGGSFGDTDVAAGNAIETTVTALTVNASAGNGSIFARESDGLTALNLNAGTGSIVLHSVTGDVADTDSADDVTASAFGFSSGSGSLGTSSNLINSQVANLEVNATGAVYISNAVALVIGSVNSTLTGIDATGVVDIRSVGALSVNESVTTTTGNVTLQARESAADSTSDLLAISDGITVSTNAGAITLNGGDGVTAGANSVITAASTTPATATITVNVDNAAGALGADNDTSAGGLVDFDTSSPDPAVTAPGGLTVNGGANEDTFLLKPFASGTITVNGGGPSLPAGSDQLALDLSDVAVGKSTVLLGQAAASGTMTFGAGETEKTVTFSSVEEVSANPTANAYHLVLDMTYSGFADGNADTIELERADGVSNATTDDLLEIYVNGGSAPFFSGAQSGILSLTVIGSTDDDQLQITETSLGMPQLAAVTPAIGAVAVDNTALTPAGGVTAGSHLIASGKAFLVAGTNTTASDWDRTDVAIHFDGGSSPDID
ncbi:MAG: beta strand repeat-containing protein, partial [Planctomycetota bacterium]